MFEALKLFIDFQVLMLSYQLLFTFYIFKLVNTCRFKVEEKSLNERSKQNISNIHVLILEIMPQR